MEKETQIDIKNYLNILLRRKWIILVSFASILIFTFVLTEHKTPTYQATATVMLSQKGGLPEFSYMGYVDRRNIINNQIEIIKSSAVMNKAVEKIKEKEPESPLLSNPALWGMIAGVSVATYKNTDIIKISATASSGKDAATIANAVADAFKEYNLQYIKGEINEVRSFLEEQLPQVEERLKKSEERLRKFKEENRIVSLTAETSELTSKLSEFDRFYNETETELLSSEKRLDYLREQLKKSQSTLIEDITEVSSPYIQQLRMELVSLQTDYSRFLVQGLTEDHPAMVEMNERIEETKKKLREETQKLLKDELSVSDPLKFSQNLIENILSLEVDIASLEAKKNALSKLIKEYTKSLLTLPEKELDLARLKREYDVNENIYKMLTQKYEEIKISEAGKVSEVNIIDYATPPSFPISPKKKQNIAFGFVIGIGLGLSFAFLLEFLDTSIKNAEDLERYVKLPLLGSLPSMNVNKKHHNPISEANALKSTIITHSSPKSPASESYRTLRTNLRFSKPDYPIKTLLITSAAPKEGKSTVSSNLAITIAQAGFKTLLAESDLRRPVLHTIFNIKSKPGLTEFVVGKSRLDEVVKPTNIENLYVLPSGSLPPNPSELLGSSRMNRTIKKLKDKFQFLVFDSPPILAVTDASVLSSEMDGVLMVIKAGKTDRSAVVRSKELLKNVKANLLGAVLNIIPQKGFYSTYEYYYYYSEDKKGRKA